MVYSDTLVEHALEWWQWKTRRTDFLCGRTSTPSSIKSVLSLLLRVALLLFMPSLLVLPRSSKWSGITHDGHWEVGSCCECTACAKHVVGAKHLLSKVDEPPVNYLNTSALPCITIFAKSYERSIGRSTRDWLNERRHHPHWITRSDDT